MSETRFDDRIDVHTDISNREALAIVGRSLTMLAGVRKLFGWKMGLALFSLVPGTITPFTGKIIVDQVIGQESIRDGAVRFPVHLMPFIELIRDFSPMQVLLAVVVLLVVVIVLFGRGGLAPGLDPGQDSATTSEAKLSSGSSRAGGVVGGLEALVNVRLSQRLSNRLRTQLFHRLTHLPMSMIDDHRIGDSVYRVMYDAPDVPTICYEVALAPLFAILSLLIQLYLLQYSYGAVAPEIVWVACGLVPVTLLVTLPAAGFVRRLQQASRASGTATTNAIEESMSNLQAVQSLGGMDREKQRIQHKSGESFRRYRHVVIANIAINAVRMTILFGFMLFVFLFVTDRIVADLMTRGDFIALWGIGFAIGGASLSLGLTWIDLQGGTAAVRRVFFFLDADTEDRKSTLPDLPPIQHGVTFDHVDLSYANGRRALANIDLELRVGELVAFVGPTGAGKTSLAYLIPGYYHPQQGRVLIDGTNIDEVNLESLRGQISYVFQEHLLLSESIRSNLALANPRATEAQMRAALATAGAADFVDELPDGLDTVLGRSGGTLSVGQQQRLSIARGLVRDTPILILDEPTAALDPQTENALVRALRQAGQGRLVIIIAHRLSTIRHADRIVFLDGGEIQCVGSHDELMADANGRYRAYVELQSGT